MIIQHLPEMRKGVVDALDMVFTPKQIATQVVLAVALESSLVRKYSRVEQFTRMYVNASHLSGIGCALR